MTRRGRLSKLEAQADRQGEALEVWSEDQDAAGMYRRTLPASDMALPLEEVLERKVGKLILVEYVEGQPYKSIGEGDL